MSQGDGAPMGDIRVLRAGADRRRVSARRHRWPSTAPILAASILTGCAVGPDFVPPEPPPVAGPPRERIRTSACRPQAFLQGADIPDRWWELFRSRALNDLIEQANPAQRGPAGRRGSRAGRAGQCAGAARRPVPAGGGELELPAPEDADCHPRLRRPPTSGDSTACTPRR